MEKGEQGQAVLRRSMGWRAPEDRLTPARSIVVAVELSIVCVCVCVYDVCVSTEEPVESSSSSG